MSNDNKTTPVDKNIKDYLHLYLGCEVEYKRFSEEKQDYELVTRILDIHCLLTIEMLYGEGSLIDVLLHLRPLSDITEEENHEHTNISANYPVTESLLAYTIGIEAEQTKYLLSKHFDLFNLIPDGLAIDKTKIKNHGR